MSNRAVSDAGPGRVEVIDTPHPEFELEDGPGVNPANVGRQVNHGVILKTIATNICGSDPHMVRGRTTAPEGLVLFNIACGRCRNCKEGRPASV